MHSSIAIGIELSRPLLFLCEKTLKIQASRFFGVVLFF